MILSMLFVIMVTAGVFKMAYDHQIYKDLNKIKIYGQKNQEGTEEGIQEARLGVSTRRVTNEKPPIARGSLPWHGEVRLGLQYATD